MTRRIRSAAVCFLALGLALSAGRGAAANTNIDFAAHVAFGAPAYHAIAIGRGFTVTGFFGTLVVFNSTKPESPAVAGSLELGTAIYDVAYFGGRYAFVATTASGLVVVDVSVPSAPTRAGALALTGSALSVAVNGSTAYVGTTTGLYVVDVSTPTAPTLKGSVTGFAAGKVAVNGNYVYAACGSAGIKVVDATTPTAPTVAATVATSSSAQSVAVSGSALYAAMGGTGLAIYGISTPTAPTLSATLSVGGNAYGVAANGTTVFVAGAALSVVDASTSSSPRLIGQVALDSPGQGIAVVNNRLEIIGVTGMSIIDISTPTAPTKAALYPAIINASDIVIDGDVAATSGSLNSVIIMDVSVPKHPTLRGAVALGSGGHGRLRLKDGYAFFGSGGAVYVVDATATPPATVKTLSTGSAAVRGLAIAGKYLFVAAYSPNVVLAYDVSVASSPTLVGVLSTPFVVDHLAAYNGFLYLTGGTTLQIVDARVPASMSLRGQFIANGTIADVAVSGAVAHVPTNAGLTLLDVSAPDAPQWLSFDAAPGTSYAIALSGTRAYVASDPGAFVEDVHDPYAPASVGLFDGAYGKQVIGIAETAGWAFAATYTDGVYIFHSAGECYDPFERNNDQAEAWPLPVPSIRQPMICDANDVDWFKVTAPSGGTIQAAMTPPTGANYDLFLYDAAGNPVAGSIAAGDATESVAYTVRQGGDWYLKVVGASGSCNAALPYTLYTTFSACVAPTQPVYVYGSVRDANNNVTLNIQDPNQPASAGGYNIYRATAPQGPWTLLAADVVDMDKSLANVQYTDVGSNDGATYFYRATAVNAACGSEGP